MATSSEIRNTLELKRKRRVAIRIIALFLSLLLIILAIIYRDKLSPDAISNWLSQSVTADSGKTGFPVQLPPGEILSVDAQGSNVLVTNQTGLYFYSPSGKLLRSVNHAKKNAQAICSGDNVLAFEVGGSLYSVETDSKTKISKELKASILTGAISKNGRFALVTDSDVYTCDMQVYDKNGNAVFKWSPSGSAISAVALSQDGYHVAAATVYTQNGKLISGVHLFSTSKSEALISKNLEDEIVLKLNCQSNSISVITDKGYFTVNSEGEIVKRYDFGEKKLITSKPYKNGMVFVFEDVNDPNKSVLSVVSKDANEIAGVNIDGKAIDSDISGETVYILTQSHLYSYDVETAIRRGTAALEDEGERLCATVGGGYVVTSTYELIKPELK